MDSPNKDYLIVDTLSSQSPEIGRWLWALQDTRQRTLEELNQVTPTALDWLPPDHESSIGTILYHIALIEADWLYAEVREQSIPAEVMTLFPYPHRDDQGHLTQVEGFSLEHHLKRLETVRNLLLDVYQQMDLTDFRRARSLANYEVTPEWVLHHLMQHEAEHRSQIGALRQRAENELTPG